VDGEYYYFSVTIPKEDNPPKEVVVSVNVSTLDICLTFNASPVKCQFNGTKVITLPWPRVGVWYGRVHQNPVPGKFESNLLAPVPFQITAVTSVCPIAGNVGPYCNETLTIGDKTLLSEPSIAPLGSLYYRVAASYPSNPFWITVGSTPLSAFQVYVSLSQIPTPNNYDLIGCNQPFCDRNIIINLNNTATLTGNQTFFVLIKNLVNATVSLGVWFNSICAPGCEGNGQCTTGGPGTGLCVCPADWAGYSCTISVDNGLPAQYIVLIIIASLVVASAIIGFIAWAYMQKKRSGYVKVKD
jgi:hypothetical protein